MKHLCDDSLPRFSSFRSSTLCPPSCPSSRPQTRHRKRGWASRTLAVGALCTIFALLPVRSEAASFRGLGAFPGQPFESVLVGLNPDGSQLVGRAAVSSAGVSGFIAFDYDEAALSLTAGVGDLPGGALASRGVDQRSIGPAGSPTDRYTVGDSVGANGRRIWIRHETLPASGEITTYLPLYPKNAIDMTARGISESRRVIGDTTYGLGGSSSQRFYYDPDSGSFTALPHEHVEAIDDSGSRIVGSWLEPVKSREEALLWDETRGNIPLGWLPGGDVSRAFGISPSGRVVVGESRSNAAPGGEAFRWHPDLGLHPLEPIPRGQLRASRALASSDANVVVGWYSLGGSGRAAFLWNPVQGRVDLRDYLITQHGLFAELIGWQLTEATEISRDGKIIAGNGINPAGLPEAWVVDLDGPDRAEVRLAPVDPDGSPSTWKLSLKCGDLGIAELYFGIVPPQTFVPGQSSWDFGGCQNEEGIARFCTGAPEIGPTVSEQSFLIAPGSDLPFPARNDTIYAHLIGVQQQLCRPGDDETDLGLLRLPKPTPEILPSDFDGFAGLQTNGNELPDDAVRFSRSRIEPVGADLFVRPAPDDQDGSRWLVTLESETAFSTFSFGLIMPPGADQVFFAGCEEAVGPDNHRICADETDLGTDIDFSAVRTIGPSANLAEIGLRTDTIYVFLAGKLEGLGQRPAMNIPGQPSRLGLFRFGDPPFPNIGFVPTLSYEQLEVLDDYWNEIEEWSDSEGANVQTYQLISGTGFGGSGDPNWDGDAFEDAEDRCPYVATATNDDGGTLEQVGRTPVAGATPDGIGNDCQCGASLENPEVYQIDISLLRSALADSSVAQGLTPTSRAKCNSIGPVLGTIDPITELPMDCKVNDIFALLRGRVGEAPMIPNPGEFPTCPDVNTP